MSAPSPSYPAPAPVLIGRERELIQLRAWVDNRKSGLAVITGRGSMGKSTLARELQRYAEASGCTVPGGVGNHLAVDASSDPQDIEDQLRAQLEPDVELNEDTDTLDRLRDPGAIRRGSVASAAPESKRDWEMEPQVSAARNRPRLAWVTVHRASSETMDVLRDQVRALAGRTASTPLLLVVTTDVAADAEALADVTELTVPLGALDRQPVRDHLVMVSDGLVPTMGADELDMYVEATRRDPPLLTSLTAVLPLARPGSGAERLRTGG